MTASSSKHDWNHEEAELVSFEEFNSEDQEDPEQQEEGSIASEAWEGFKEGWSWSGFWKGFAVGFAIMFINGIFRHFLGDDHHDDG